MKKTGNAEQSDLPCQTGDCELFVKTKATLNPVSAVAASLPGLALEKILSETLSGWLWFC
jgi:hypothetical protein